MGIESQMRIDFGQGLRVLSVSAYAYKQREQQPRPEPRAHASVRCKVRATNPSVGCENRAFQAIPRKAAIPISTQTASSRSCHLRQGQSLRSQSTERLPVFRLRSSGSCSQTYVTVFTYRKSDRGRANQTTSRISSLGNSRLSRQSIALPVPFSVSLDVHSRLTAMEESYNRNVHTSTITSDKIGVWTVTVTGKAGI